MTTSIVRVSSEAAYDLIYDEYLSKLSVINQESMHRAIMNSARIWIGYIDDEAVAFWGLIPPSFLSDTAYLWLYTDERISEYSFVFIRNSKLAVEEMLREFPIIVGHAKLGADKSCRWLRWLGAKFAEPQGQFIPFEIRAT